MKKVILRGKDNRGFTLVEMVIVLFIISLLSLLFIPNITSTRNKVESDSISAFTTVIKTQAELYKLQTGKDATLETLKSEKYIDEGQYDKAISWEINIGNVH